MPGLADLFVDATRAWSDGMVPRVWCEGCQVVAEDILEANKALRQLPDGLNKVSGFVRCILWAHHITVSTSNADFYPGS